MLHNLDNKILKKIITALLLLIALVPVLTLSINFISFIQKDSVVSVQTVSSSHEKAEEDTVDPAVEDTPGDDEPEFIRNTNDMEYYRIYLTPMYGELTDAQYQKSLAMLKERFDLFQDTAYIEKDKDIIIKIPVSSLGDGELDYDAINHIIREMIVFEGNISIVDKEDEMNYVDIDKKHIHTTHGPSAAFRSLFPRYNTNPNDSLYLDNSSTWRSILLGYCSGNAFPSPAEETNSSNRNHRAVKYLRHHHNKQDDTQNKSNAPDHHPSSFS